jgi:hypothetical protein
MMPLNNSSKRNCFSAFISSGMLSAATAARWLLIGLRNCSLFTMMVLSAGNKSDVLKSTKYLHFKASIDKVPLKSVDSKPVLLSIVNFES